MWERSFFSIIFLLLSSCLQAEQKWGVYVFMSSDDGEYWMRLEVFQSANGKEMLFSEKSKYQICLNSFIYHHYLGQNGEDLQESIAGNKDEMIESANRCLREYSETLPVIQDLVAGDYYKGRHSIKRLYD